MPSLSVCLIAKNEAKTIGRCLQSLLPIAEEIILVDTGSTDETITIAHSFGAKVFSLPWENNFSKARNASLHHATKDWILVMDCDEVFPDSQIAPLKALLTQDLPYYAIQFKVHNIIGGKLSSSALVLRLFRNYQGFHFIGAIHEQVSVSILETYGPESVTSADLFIEHYGYDDSLVSQQAKSDRNLTLLLSTPDAEKNGYYYFVLGNEYSRRSDYPTAALCFQQSLTLSDFAKRADVYYPYVVINLASIYYSLGHYDKALKLCDENELLLPNFKDLYMLKSIIYHTIGKLSASSKYLHLYMDCLEVPIFYPSEQYTHIHAQDFLETFESLTSPPLVYTCLFIKEPCETLLPLIRNLHNVSHKIFAFIKSSDLSNLSEILPVLKAYNLEIITLPESDSPHFLDYIISEVKNQWILILHENEFIPLSALNLLKDLLIPDAPSCYSITCFDQHTTTYTSEPRLVSIDLSHLVDYSPTQAGDSCLIAFKNYTL